MHFWNSWPGLYMRHLASPQKMFFPSVAIVFCCILSTSSPSFLIAELESFCMIFPPSPFTSSLASACLNSTSNLSILILLFSLSLSTGVVFITTVRTT